MICVCHSPTPAEDVAAVIPESALDWLVPAIAVVIELGLTSGGGYEADSCCVSTHQRCVEAADRHVGRWRKSPVQYASCSFRLLLPDSQSPDPSSVCCAEAML